MFNKTYKKIITIEGMHCEHCAKKVESAFNKINGVKKVKVSLTKKEAIIISNQELPNSIFESSLKDSDFKITSIK